MYLQDSNHQTINLLTNGFLDTSLLVRGFVIPYFQYEIIGKRHRRGGGGTMGTLYGDIDKFGVEEIDVIRVHVKWNKQVNRDKRIYAELIEKKIEAELIERYSKKISIDVDLID